MVLADPLIADPAGPLTLDQEAPVMRVQAAPNTMGQEVRLIQDPEDRVIMVLVAQPMMAPVGRLTLVPVVHVTRDLAVLAIQAREDGPITVPAFVGSSPVAAVRRDAASDVGPMTRWRTESALRLAHRRGRG